MASNRDRSFRQMIKAAVVKIRILSTMNEMGLQLHLKKAVESNDLVETKDTIARGASVNARSPAGSTYLMEASRLGHISIVKFLIKSHAAVNAVNFQNNTALHYAYQKQQYEVIQYLESHGAAPSHKILNAAGLTPRKFMYAKLPLDRKLKVACQHGDLQNAEFFALQGADVNFKTLAGSTPLMDAVWYGHSHVVDFLLRSGADIEHKTKAGNTALHMAYQKFHLPVINILERQGANKLALNKKGLTPAKMLYLKGKLNHKLRLACQFGDVSGAALFIEKGADINSASKKTGATPLMDACWAGNKEIVNLLMVCGADISLKNNRKNTALHLAIQRGFSELIPILMKGVHADKATKIKNYIGLRPEDLGKVVAATASKDEGMYSDDLSKACATGNTYLVKDLCRSSAIDINAQSESGTTVLMDAVYQGHVDVVEVLLRARANPNAKTFRGQTVLHFAYERNDAKIIQMLERAKAKPVKNLAGQMPQDLRPSTDGFDVKRRSSKATFRFESSKSKVTISNPLHDRKKHSKHPHFKRQSPGKLAALTPLESKKGGIAAADIESKIGLAMVQTDASLVALTTAKPTVAVSVEEADKRKEQALKAYLNPESKGAPIVAGTPTDVFGKRSVLGKLDPLAQKVAQEKAAEENRKAVEAAAQRKRRADEERQAKLEADRQAMLAAEEEKRRQRQAKQLERERRRKAQKNKRHSPAGGNDDDAAAKAAAEEAAKAAAEAAEAARRAAEKAEQERKAREDTTAARLAKEKAEADKRVAEEAEKERLAKQKAEAEKKAAEEAEKERLAKEKALAEQIAKDKAEAERLAAARVEADRLEAEKVAAAAEAARLAEEKAEEERLAAEAEKDAAEKAEAERLAAEKAAADAAEAARLAAAKAEAERIAAIKDAEERAAAEKAEAERKAAEEAEAQRKAEEERVRAEEARLEKEKIMAARLARMKAAASAAAAAKHAAEQAEAARVAAEKKAEEERLAAEKALAEKIALAKAEEERLAAERAAAAAERERQEAEERKRKEEEEQARQKAEAERQAAEQQAEQERIAVEKAAAEAAEAARVAAEKAAAAAEAARIAAERKIHKQREEVAAAETASIMAEAAQEAERIARQRREAKKRKQEEARKAAQEEATRVAAAAQEERRRKAEEKAKAAAAEASAKRESKLSDSSGGASNATAEPLSVAEAYERKIQDWEMEEANTLLLEAVLARELADVKTFVDEGADVNTVDGEGYSPLLIASYSGAHDIVGYLLEQKSNIFFQDAEGTSALAAAAQSGHLQCVRRLLQHSHDTLDLCVSNRSSPLFLAAQEGHVDVVSTLLQADADLELEREDGWTALAIAAQENQVEIVRLLLDAKADPTRKTADGHTAQYLTSSQEIFKLLKAVLPDDAGSKNDAPGGVSDNEFALWLWGKAVEHNANLVCETVVEFLDKLAPGQGEALDEALDEYDVDVPATLDSFMHLLSVIEWTESAVDTLRHWTQQEDCGTFFFYNTLTHVSTYDNPFQVTASPWEKIVDDGGVYYYNNVTQESQWEKPDGFIDTSESADATASGESVAAANDPEHDPRDDWEEVHDYDAHYFYNRVTGETAWKLPDFDKLAAKSGDSSTSTVSSPSKKSKKAKKDKKSKQHVKGLAKHGSNGGNNGDGSEVEMRYTLNPNDNEQGKNDTSNFVYRIDPADHWEQHEEFDSKFYQNRITGESHSDTDDGGVIPPEWEAHNEMNKQFFANSSVGEEWELQFSASDGKCRFVETSSGREQEYPPWIRSDAEAATVLRDEPWRVLWLKLAHREHQQARGD